MGYSWALSLKVTIPSDRIAGFRAADVATIATPSRWGRANDSDPQSVEALAKRLAAEEMLETSWTESGSRSKPTRVRFLIARR